ncbi:MAG: DNA-binding protein [Eubacteriaceae bacterium]|jgi:predicted DNA-binding protein YlxM (UPF0122 family)|nr:DNA-binding protein [Eubacteriaceae bacterium]
MKKTIEEQLTFDFYGELLSERQKTVLAYYYNDDCSVPEIAELTHMTRQGAYDACKRGKRQMADFEKKLGLVTRFQKSRRLLAGIVDELSGVMQMEGVQQDPVIQRELGGIVKKIEDLSDEF